MTTSIILPALPSDPVLLLREARMARGLTQRQLARLSGVGEKTISSWETGDRAGCMKLDQLLAILGALGLTVQQFFAGEVYPDGSVLKPRHGRDFYLEAMRALMRRAAHDGVTAAELAEMVLEAHIATRRGSFQSREAGPMGGARW